MTGDFESWRNLLIAIVIMIVLYLISPWLLLIVVCGIIALLIVAYRAADNGHGFLGS
jgi:hypothetical protein